MLIELLGTGSSPGVPVPGCDCPVCTSTDPKDKRLRCSVKIIDNADNVILIDTGPDFRYQCLRAGIKRIDAILYTHAHADHILGIDDLRIFNYRQKNSIPAYATHETFREIQKFFHYVFEPNLDYVGPPPTKLEMNEISYGNPFHVFENLVNPFRLIHGKTEVTGFRVGSFAYATDCNTIPTESMEILKGVDVLVLDALRLTEHPSHLSLTQATEIAKLLGIRKTYLTHMTHDVDQEAARKLLPEGIELAYDGLEIECI